VTGIFGLVESQARAAAAAAPLLARASNEVLTEALQRIASRLRAEASIILDSNREDLAAAETRLSRGLLDRLRLDDGRIEAIGAQVESLASLPSLERLAGRRVLPNGLEVEERRVPVGVVGAIYEARPNVTVDIATQLIKSKNAGLLRTGSAGLRTAAALLEAVIAPALAESGLKPEAIQVLRSGEHEGAEALVSLPHLVPLVIIRGSGQTTKRLARIGTEKGVRTLQHAEGGGVVYLHSDADNEMALRLIESSLDRLGVCNRLNLLLVDRSVWDRFLPQVLALFDRMGIAPSLPPHDHPLGYEWAGDPERESTVTIAPAEGVEEAVGVANEQTPGLAASIVTQNEKAARNFLDAYRGTGGFWNATTRFLDGFELTLAPETGINVEHVPGPRGPVTYRDLFLRQYVVVGDGTQHR
jgi:glutamate-5-semialdehyde dehydrogenase